MSVILRKSTSKHKFVWLIDHPKIVVRLGYLIFPQQRIAHFAKIFCICMYRFCPLRGSKYFYTLWSDSYIGKILSTFCLAPISATRCFFSFLWNDRTKWMYELSIKFRFVSGLLNGELMRRASSNNKKIVSKVEESRHPRCTVSNLHPYKIVDDSILLPRTSDSLLW